MKDIYCQANYNDSFTSAFWPTNVTGDTSKFTRGNRILKSNSNNSAKHNFGLQFISNQSNAFELQATIQSDINLSSSNFIEFGFKDSNQKSTFIRLGNTLDQLQIFINDSLEKVGPEKEFNVSKLNLNIKIIVLKNILKVIQLNLNDHTKTEYSFKLIQMNFNCREGFIKITQFGSSAIAKHSFQDIYVGGIRDDTIPPKINAIQQITNNSLEILFSEPILNLQKNHIICNQIPIDSVAMNQDSTTLNIILLNNYHLSFDSLQLQIIQLVDQNNNTKKNLIIFCNYRYIDTPKFGDIILNEIMVKPSPTLGQLPEKKYIEIFNPTNQFYNLNCLILTDQYTQCYLPNYQIKPKEYIAIGYKGDTSDFKFTNFLGVNSFPSFNQEEDHVILKTKKNEILFNMHYLENMMNLEYRNGGYSLEKINLKYKNQEIENWSSNKNIGGSPGKPNDQTEVFIPQEIKLIEAYHTSDSIYLRVNSTLNPNSIYTAICNGKNVNLKLVQNEILTGKLPDSLSKNSRITIENLFEFDSLISGNSPANISYRYTFNSSKLDFNEILFHNYVGNPDYIEFVNNDTSAIFLDQFVLNIYQEDEISLKQQFALKNTKRWLMKPQELLCFTNEKSKILNQFSCSQKQQIIEKNDFPNFTSETGHLKLIHLNSGASIKNELNYSSKMHSSFYSETTGISLEKLNETLQSKEQNSWTSATQSFQYGSPGIENSVKINFENTAGQNHFNLRKNTIHDLETLILDYSFNEAGYIINASIYNKNGFLITNCIQNYRASNEGIIHIHPHFQFQMLPTENYILKLEAFLPNVDLCRQIIRFTILNSK